MLVSVFDGRLSCNDSQSRAVAKAGSVYQFCAEKETRIIGAQIRVGTHIGVHESGASLWQWKLCVKRFFVTTTFKSLRPSPFSVDQSRAVTQSMKAEALSARNLVDCDVSIGLQQSQTKTQVSTLLNK